MKRIYENVISQHFERYKQMLFLAGPRQVGKTTASLTAKKLSKYFTYLNWDNQDDRQIIINGPAAVMQIIGLNELQDFIPIIVFDKLHKYRYWKIFLRSKTEQ